MANSYLTSVKEFTDRSPFGEDLAERLDQSRPGLLLKLASSISAEMDVRLGKKYLRPIPNPPEIVKLWAADLLTPRAYEALGVRPTDEQQEQITARATQVYAFLKEAADSENGLLDLPLSATISTSGIQEPTILSQSEQSPYTWRHKQFDAVNGSRRYG